MFFRNLAFDSPWYLLLLTAVPLIWIGSFKSLAGLGRVRRLMALSLRTAVYVLLVLSLANTQYRRALEKMTVIYLLDQSDSIPVAQREAMVEYVTEAVRRHRDDSRRDRAAVIVFGRDANIEVHPVDDDLPLAGRLDSLFDLRVDATNLAGAMKLAQATFPEDSARRIVVITDGNENLGDARMMAQLLAEHGIGVDVVPVPLAARSEIAVERIVLPSDIRKGQPFEARVVVNNLTPPSSQDARAVRGVLQLTRRMGQTTETLDEAEVELPPGKRVFRFQHKVDQPDFYEYRATFVPDNPHEDHITRNNRATAFTHVGGQGHVLLIEDFQHRDATGQGQFHTLVQRLRTMDIQDTVQFTDELFTNLAELQRYDTVILANVPRSSGSDADSLVNFSNRQVEMLVRNTQEMGCGLIMMGGPNSFGAGGWSNSELEKAMPVNFQIHNAKVQAVGALVMVMHASEMAQGNFWQKEIGREALKTLGPQDYCGVIHWVGREEWLWGQPIGLTKVGQDRNKMISRLSRMTPGDMPEFDPSMKMAAAAFSAIPEAAVKHMIIISDGDPGDPRQSTIASLVKAGAKVSTVAVGTHGAPASTPLQKIARQTGGKFYLVTDPRALPRIYQREARRVARPLVREKTVQPQIRTRHEMLQGIDAPPPPITGFVLTTIKENPLVEVQLVSPEPADERNATILASWHYGLGRAVALTTDAGGQWATQWTGWEGYDKLFTQMVRWSMRPSGDTGNFTVAHELKDGKVRVIITALDKDDEFLNFLDMSASVVQPDMKSSVVPIQQIAPGRYLGEFDSETPGSYFLTVHSGAGRRTIRSGVNVPYSSEYRDRHMNQALLETLVSLQPVGGSSGKTITGPLVKGQMDELLQTNTFRHDLAKAISSDYIWPLLLLVAGCIFFADVFVRRVAISLEWIGPLWNGLRDAVLRKEVELPADERLARLRSRKDEVGEKIEQRRAAIRFEPAPDNHAKTDVAIEGAIADQRDQSQSPPSAGQAVPEDVEEEDYTARLLKAKKQVWEDKKRGKGQSP